MISWDAVGRLVDRAPGVSDLRAHGLHLLAAARWRQQGRPVPSDLLEEERGAVARLLAAPLVLQRMRDACEGPLVLMKGYEVALRYREPTSRPFGDIDVLAPAPEQVSQALRAAGFQPVGYPGDYYDRRHHLCPLLLPDLPIVVEVHRRPEWVRWSTPPPMEELVEHAVPSRSGVAGILALTPAQHALVVAAHSWSGAPLRRILDIVDTAVLASEAAPDEVEAWASRWDLTGLWRFDRRCQDALLGGGTPPASVRIWGRSMLHVRDASVLEQHERRVLAPFAVLPARRALGQAARQLWRSLAPAAGESWATKAARAGLAVRHAFVARARHDALLAERIRSRR